MTYINSTKYLCYHFSLKMGQWHNTRLGSWYDSLHFMGIIDCGAVICWQACALLLNCGVKCERLEVIKKWLKLVD